MTKAKMTVGDYVNDSYALHAWILDNLNELDISKDKRSLLSVCAFDTVIEHFLGAITLIKSKIYGSAFSLVRPIFETFVRGVWLKNCAEDAELVNFQKDRVKKEFWEILKLVEGLEAFKSGSLSSLKKQAWSAMSSYTHGGFQQISRRVKSGNLYPDFEDEEIIEVLKISQMFALLAFIQVAIEVKRDDLVQVAIGKLYSMGLFKKKN